MSDFVYPIYILSLSEDKHFKEYTCEINKKFLKTILTDDIYTFNSFVDSLISELCVSPIELKDLTVLDKFYIVCALRYNNVGPTLDMSVKLEDNQFFKHEVQIFDILQILENADITFESSLEVDNTKIDVCIPNIFTQSSNLFDCVINSVSRVEFSDKIIDMHQYTFQEKQAILDKLPGGIVPHVYTFIQQQEEKLRRVPIIDIHSDVELPFDKTVYLSLINNSLFEAIKLLFNFNLRDVYNIEYTLIKKFNFSYGHISKLTPAELQVYFSVIAEDLEKEKEEREKQQQSDQYSVPPPNNMPHV